MQQLYAILDKTTGKYLTKGSSNRKAWSRLSDAQAHYDKLKSHVYEHNADISIVTLQPVPADQGCCRIDQWEEDIEVTLPNGVVYHTHVEYDMRYDVSTRFEDLLLAMGYSVYHAIWYDLDYPDKDNRYGGEDD